MCTARGRSRATYTEKPFAIISSTLGRCRYHLLAYAAPTLFLLLSTLTLPSCTREYGIVASDPSLAADTLSLTEAAATSLSPTGEFLLAMPPTDSKTEVSEANARRIAAVWIASSFPWVQREIEREHGAAIDKSQLRPCRRLYYAQSPYEDVQDPSEGGFIRRAFGPWWLVPLCVGKNTVALLGVAGYATDISVLDNHLELPPFSGSELTWGWIPQTVSQFPIPPEAAAQSVARQTSAKISAAPTLVMPDFRDGGPALAHWEFNIVPERQFRALQSNRRLVLSKVSYGLNRPGDFAYSLSIPAANDSAPRPFRYVPPQSKTGINIDLRKKANSNLRFEKAEVVLP